VGEAKTSILLVLKGWWVAFQERQASAGFCRWESVCWQVQGEIMPDATVGPSTSARDRVFLQQDCIASAFEENKKQESLDTLCLW